MNNFRKPDKKDILNLLGVTKEDLAQVDKGIERSVEEDIMTGISLRQRDYEFRRDVRSMVQKLVKENKKHQTGPKGGYMFIQGINVYNKDHTVLNMRYVASWSISEKDRVKLWSVADKDGDEVTLKNVIFTMNPEEVDLVS